MSHSMPGLPEQVTIYEVGPRDGLQNEAAIVPLDVKVEFIERLVAAGLRIVEDIHRNVPFQHGGVSIS